MKQRKIIWMFGTLLIVSLLTTAPGLAATKSAKARIPAAKRHQVTQISDRDVVLSRNPLAGGGRLVRLQPALGLFARLFIIGQAKHHALGDCVGCGAIGLSRKESGPFRNSFHVLKSTLWFEVN